MATLTIKNVPDALYQQLKESAAKHRRSINNEAIVSLERALGKTTEIDREALLERIRARREKMNIFLTAEDIQRAKNEGRP